LIGKERRKYMNREVILQCLSEILETDRKELDELDVQIPLEDIGFTSLKFITFIVQIEGTLEIEVLDSDLLFEKFSTLENLFETLSKYFPEERNLKKVLILDADNVLWKGISGEETIVIDGDVLSFQNFLTDLYDRGVLLCLCSKNQNNFIEDSFASPKMVLKKEHFAVFVANQKDKVTNIRFISEELKLSEDSFVFVDDSDYELGYVSASLPEIECIKFSYTTLECCAQAISDIFSCVQKNSDINRTKLYHEQKEREKDKKIFLSVDEYNNSLNTHIVCKEANSEECLRLSELSIRTHQFNLSNREYTKEELENLLCDSNYKIFSLSAQDKYGDMGIVGMAVVNRNVIESFMLSCRVFGRDFEKILINKIKEASPAQIFGVYVPTDKNCSYSDFYKDNGVNLYDK